MSEETPKVAMLRAFYPQLCNSALAKYSGITVCPSKSTNLLPLHTYGADLDRNNIRQPTFLRENPQIKEYTKHRKAYSYAYKMSAFLFLPLAPRFVSSL